MSYESERENVKNIERCADALECIVDVLESINQRLIAAEEYEQESLNLSARMTLD